MQGDIVLDVDGAGDEIPALEDEASASVGGDVVDCRLQGRRVQRLPVGLGTEFGGKVILGARLNRECGGKDQDRYDSE